jgi:DNA replication protein DnaC
MDTLINAAGQLKLFGLQKTLDIRLAEATQHAWSYQDFLKTALVDELHHRRQKSTEYRVRRARFRLEASFDHYDHTTKRNLTKAQLEQLKALQFVEKKQSLLLLGPTGVGKTFLATAIGYEACLRGHTCQFLGMNLFIEQALVARSTGQFLKFRERLITCGILILDDLGIKPLPAGAVQDLYDILEERYQSRPTIITSQLPLVNWKEVIEDEVALEAILDRLIHGQRLELKGESYRKVRGVDKAK